MRFGIFAPVLAAAVIAGCSSGGYAPPAIPGSSAIAPMPGSALVVTKAEAAGHKKKSYVYWTLFGSCSYPQIQWAAVPLKTKSKAKNYNCSKQNGLSYTSGLAVDSAGRLWVLSFSSKGASPSEVAVFKLPLKSTSVQQYTFVLSGTNGADAIAFDPSGNLWVTSAGNAEVLQYTGPFDKSGTIYPATTIGEPSGFSMYSLALDKNADLYASNFDSTGSYSIGVLAPPYNGTPYFLNGLTAPGGIAFDTHGNLYASSNGSTSQAAVRYDSNDLQSGDTPSIVDPTGLPASTYLASFAFSSKGDLYAANCGSPSTGAAGIDVWPLSKRSFSSKLAPSLVYTTSDVTKAGCAWGIAIK